MATRSSLLILLIAFFNWLAPLDEKCLGSLDYDTKAPTVECYDLDNGVVEYDVRLG